MLVWPSVDSLRRLVAGVRTHPTQVPSRLAFIAESQFGMVHFSFVGNNRLSVISSAVICEGPRLHWLLPWAWELAAALRRRLRPGGLVPPRERSAKARDNKWIIQSLSIGK